MSIHKFHSNLWRSWSVLIKTSRRLETSTTTSSCRSWGNRAGLRRDLMMIDPTEESVDNPGSQNFASPVPCNNHCQRRPPMKHPTALPLQERAWTYGCLTQFLKEGKKKIIKNKQLFQIETTLQRFPPVLSLLYGMTSANLNTRAKTLRVHAIPFMDPKEILI